LSPFFERFFVFSGPRGFDSICECSLERINWLSANLWSKKKKKQSNRLFAHF
jgi:hypothetical protein